MRTVRNIAITKIDEGKKCTLNIYGIEDFCPEELFNIAREINKYACATVLERSCLINALKENNNNNEILRRYSDKSW